MYSHLTPSVAAERTHDDLDRAGLHRLAKPAEQHDADRRRVRVAWLARNARRVIRAASA